MTSRARSRELNREYIRDHFEPRGWVELDRETLTITRLPNGKRGYRLKDVLGKWDWVAERYALDELTKTPPMLLYPCNGRDKGACGLVYQRLNVQFGRNTDRAAKLKELRAWLDPPGLPTRRLNGEIYLLVCRRKPYWIMRPKPKRYINETTWTVDEL